MLLLIPRVITAIRKRYVTADVTILAAAATAATGVPFRSPFLLLLFQGRLKTKQQRFEVSVGGSGDSEPGDSAKRGVLRGFPSAAAAALLKATPEVTAVGGGGCCCRFKLIPELDGAVNTDCEGCCCCCCCCC